MVKYSPTDKDHLQAWVHVITKIKDSLLDKGSIQVTVLAMADTEGMIVKVLGKNIPANTSLVIIYGGATGKKFSRDGDIGADPNLYFIYSLFIARTIVLRLKKIVSSYSMD